MPYDIVMHELAVRELEDLRAFDQRRLVAEIRGQLSDQPTTATRRRKCLIDLTPSFEHDLPVWELRVGPFRVFYDVADEDRRVHVRAIRRKQPPQKTEDIL
ncbi:MAG TPA: type II toxin-antitoxin system RelE/ParE family toxin [Pirellulales bacterium]|nr:type II toxin-antitoxin system RelE/ParE family toxin [Pirellulales bacterium]